jgi:hypothetical protein
MNRLIFETTWFNVNWDTWNNTLLIQDLTFFIKTLDHFLETLDVFFFQTRNSEDLLFCSSLNLSNMLYMNIKKMDFLFLNFTDYSITFDLHATTSINLSSVFFFLPYINLLEYVFFFLYFFFLCFKFNQNYNLITWSNKLVWIINYEVFIVFLLNIIFIKFESFEEALCVIIFWPWCIALVFTHLIVFENNEIFFIFIEWGLPVIYGYLIICEYFWSLGSYFFIYLNGTRGRRSLIFTLIEDLIAFFILLARVSLQMIRGIICGLYHDFFREITEFIIDTWDSFFYLYSWQMPFLKTSPYHDLLIFFINLYLIAFVLLFIYFVLFLQLMFLLIAVWLFARCWFISKKPQNIHNWNALFN